MDKNMFISTTRNLIANRVFLGRCIALENSLTLICDALEHNDLIDGANLSAQITAGWYAEGQRHTAADRGMLSAAEAWTFMFSAIGMLENTIYKKSLRNKLETQFSKDVYPEEVKDLWREVVFNQDGPVEHSQYASMDKFISELSKKHMEDLVVAPFPSFFAAATSGTASSSVSTSIVCYVMKDKYGDNYVDSIIRNEENNGWILQGRNNQQQPRSITIYDDGDVSGYQLEKTQLNEISGTKLGHVCMEMHKRKDDIFVHFGIDQPVPKKSCTVS